MRILRRTLHIEAQYTSCKNKMHTQDCVSLKDNNKPFIYCLSCHARNSSKMGLHWQWLLLDVQPNHSTNRNVSLQQLGAATLKSRLCYLFGLKRFFLLVTFFRLHKSIAQLQKFFLSHNDLVCRWSYAVRQA